MFTSVNISCIFYAKRFYEYFIEFSWFIDGIEYFFRNIFLILINNFHLFWDLISNIPEKFNKAFVYKRSFDHILLAMLLYLKFPIQLSWQIEQYSINILSASNQKEKEIYITDSMTIIRLKSISQYHRLTAKSKKLYKR